MFIKYRCLPGTSPSSLDITSSSPKPCASKAVSTAFQALALFISRASYSQLPTQLNPRSNHKSLPLELP